MRETLFPDFRNFLASERIAAPGGRILLAVSGGIDSMVMMDLMSRIAGRMELSVSVAHVNHGLRGKESDADEELVRRAAKDREFGFICKHARPRGRGNLQDAARALRREALLRAAGECGAGSVFLAHNRGDQAETVIMHMMRGSGLDGLVGMRSVSEAGACVLARPLLFASRARIERYARARAVRYREDSSNSSDKYRRNDIRLRLMPMLARFNPRIEEALCRMARGLSEESLVLDMIAEEGMREIKARSFSGGVALSVDEYRSMPQAVRLRILKKAWENLSGSPADLNSDQLSKMDEIALSNSPRGTYRLKAPYLFVKGAGLIKIQSPGAGS